MIRISIACLSVVVAAALIAGAAPAAATSTLPVKLSDSEFWKMINDFSEPNGFYAFNNFVSNEDDLQSPMAALKQRVKAGAVYIGVGPEQNFSYISTVRPAIAFIVDIRRQNMLEQLIYKALFELSEDRGAFVSRLFSRPVARKLDKSATADGIFDASEAVSADQKLYDTNLAAIYDRLISAHGFDLSAADKQGISKIYSAFFQGGPQIDYRSASNSAGGPSYRRMMTSVDREGRNWSYLETEESFRYVKQLQEKNLIVPLVGDFAGPQALSTVARYVKEHGATVGAFYTSNVDEYLFKDRVQNKFFANVAALPMDASGVLVRFVGGPSGERDGTYVLRPPATWAAVLCSMTELVQAANDGAIKTRTDLNRISKQ